MQFIAAARPILFVVMFVLILVWFGLITKLFQMLRINHPEKYKAMGEPTLIMNNSLRNNIAFMRFLFCREDRSLGDPKLSKLTAFMFYFALVYLLLFIFLFVSILMFHTVPLGR
jgi:hypothetical protein